MANTLAYYDTAAITAVKSFIVQAQKDWIKQKKETFKNKMAVAVAQW